ncbi:ABC transporter ATP-binding protein [Gottfriedia sp. NPDC057991]|uniref:ABC transporter ATP-binding protein n=1 Tax=Gottfriedia sp. NPDC057991 TaxID=3346298 RepID=UPI0036DD2386
MEIYQIKQLTFSYPEKEYKALDDVSININRGDFTVIIGKSGCGKTTLLRHLKTIITPHGNRSGEIFFMNEPIESLDLRTVASKIGFVSQNPDNQIVTDKVWHELAFGLESLGIDNQTIRLRVAEMASFFGIQNWFMKNVSELSGGQKQLLNLASVMAMQPEVLILDEPTSQLDPIAAAEFLEAIKKINNELGVTIILTEHRLEEVFPMADQVIAMENGKVIIHDSPVNVCESLISGKNHLINSLPSAMQIYSSLPNDHECPVTVRDGRNFLDQLLNNRTLKEKTHHEKSVRKSDEYIIELQDVWFKYEKNGTDILKSLSLKIERGRFYAIMGGNGTGKSTTLSVIAGINIPYRGKVLLNGKPVAKYNNKELFRKNLGVLPQNPQSLFVKKTVELDLISILKDRKLGEEELKKKISEVSTLVEIEHLLNNHPFDLSGGEQQRVALAKILLLEPKILLLDEPTKGLDNCFKEKLATILNQLTKTGVTILMVSHDVEFCAKYTERCGLFFDGNLISESTATEFFAGNSFYTTAANRISRHYFKDAITNEDVIELCKMAMQ